MNVVLYVGASLITIAGFVWMWKRRPDSRFARSAWLAVFFGWHGYYLFQANPFIAHAVATVWIYAIFDWQEAREPDKHEV